ncbi:MAG: hypothetical protein KBI01_01205 [Oscillospiraceae bacterium]|nr:hypothetical protein [Oscillospiraceae bacterium]
MKLVHEQVHHVKYGIGTVIAQTEDIVEVKFSKEFGNKKFVYPVAFETFLKVCNQASQEKMNEELRQIRDEIDSQRKMRREAEQKVIDDTHREIQAKKRAATKLTTAAKSAEKKAAKKAKEEADLAKEINDSESIAL